MPTLPAKSNRDRICLTCPDKGCCSSYNVMVTARDIWRISRAMHLAPADFLTYLPLSEPTTGAFLLHPAGTWNVLTLARRVSADPDTSPCLFLFRLNNQHALCGLGSLQPGQCRGFPMYLTEGLVGLISNPAGCVRTWSYGDLDLEGEKGNLQQFQREEAEHSRLVAEWNNRVRDAGQERTGNEFCTFLLNHTFQEEIA